MNCGMRYNTYNNSDYEVFSNYKINNRKKYLFAFILVAISLWYQNI